MSIESISKRPPALNIVNSYDMKWVKKKAPGISRSKTRLLTLQVLPNCPNSLLLVYHPTIKTAVEKMKVLFCPSSSVWQFLFLLSFPGGQLRLHLKQEGHAGHIASLVPKTYKPVSTGYNIGSSNQWMAVSSGNTLSVQSKLCRKSKRHAIDLSYCKPPFRISSYFRSSFRSSFSLNYIWGENNFLKKFSTWVPKDSCLLCSH